jgi:hypothetical protein
MLQRVALRCSELLIKDPMLNSPIALFKPTFTQRSKMLRCHRQLYLARELVVLDAAEAFVEA